MEIQQLASGFIFETLGQAYIEKGELTVRTQQSLDELKKSFSHMKFNSMEIIKTCNRYYINNTLPNNHENCGMLKEQLDQSILEIETLFEFTLQNSTRKHRGLEDIALGIFNLEFIDPTRVENVKKLNENQRLMTAHIEQNSHVINDQVDVIQALESTISEQSHYLNQSFQGYNKMIVTMRDEFDTIKSQVSIFMSMEWLISSFHENIFKMKSTLSNILNEIGTTHHISSHKAYTILNNQTLWFDILSKLGSNHEISLKDIRMSSSIQEGYFLREIVFKSLRDTKFVLVKTTPVPIIKDESILIPDSEINWVLASKTEQKYYPSMDQTFCDKRMKDYICKIPFLEILAEVSDCAVKHIFNHEAPNCTHYELIHEHGYFQRLLTASYLFVKPKSEIIYLSCEGKLSKIRIHKVGVLTPPPNCNIIDGNMIFETISAEKIFMTTHFKQVQQISVNLTKYQAMQAHSPLVLNSFQDHIKSKLRKIENPNFSMNLKDMVQPFIVGGISLTSALCLTLITFILYKTGCLNWVKIHWGKPTIKQDTSKDVKIEIPKDSHVIDMVEYPVQVRSIVRKDDTKVMKTSTTIEGH